MAQMMAWPGETLAIIQVLNVGQGDSILVELATGEVLLIDSNIPRSSEDQRPPAITFLEQIQLRRGTTFDLDLLCLTHPDADHYRGLDQIVEWFETRGRRIKRFITSASPNAKAIKLRAEEIRRNIRADQTITSRLRKK